MFVCTAQKKCEIGLGTMVHLLSLFTAYSCHSLYLMSIVKVQKAIESYEKPIRIAKYYGTNTWVKFLKYDNSLISMELK